MSFKIHIVIHDLDDLGVPRPFGASKTVTTPLHIQAVSCKFSRRGQQSLDTVVVRSAKSRPQVGVVRWMFSGPLVMLVFCDVKIENNKGL